VITSCSVAGHEWWRLGCSKIAEAEAAVSVNEQKWLVMHMHVQLQLDELRGPQTLGSLVAIGLWSQYHAGDLPIQKNGRDQQVSRLPSVPALGLWPATAYALWFV
jgi:hypothetical protein